MDSGAGNFWALVLGLGATIFGGMAVCYGLVVLGEKFVQRFHAKRAIPVRAPSVRRAA